jgi:hypothetical protein
MNPEHPLPQHAKEKKFLGEEEEEEDVALELAVLQNRNNNREDPSRLLPLRTENTLSFCAF